MINDNLKQLHDRRSDATRHLMDQADRNVSRAETRRQMALRKRNRVLRQQANADRWFVFGILVGLFTLSVAIVEICRYCFN